MSEIDRILGEAIKVEVIDHPWAEPTKVLTKEDIEAAIEKVRQMHPPCGTADRPHVVHPNTAGWTTCANCFGGVYVEGGCGARMVAMGTPSHTHVCTGPHDAGDCYCTDCGRYFWHAQEALGERGKEQS